MDADVIVAWFEKVLLPELPPGATVVLDGAGYWTGTNVVEQKLWPLSAGRQGSACCGCLRAPLGAPPSPWLPSSGPPPIPSQTSLGLRFNPIEKMFGWLKDRVEQDIDLGLSFRSDLREAIHQALERGDDRMASRARGWIDFLMHNL